MHRGISQMEFTECIITAKAPESERIAFLAARGQQGGNGEDTAPFAVLFIL